MVLLTAGLRPANPREVKLQCLEGWHGLVRALAAEAPVQLGGVVNQARLFFRCSLLIGREAARFRHAALTARPPVRSALPATCPTCAPGAPNLAALHRHPRAQVVVALLESLQEGGAVSGAAIRVLEELVLVCRRSHRDKLRTIPPLPNWLKELGALNEVGVCRLAGVGGWPGGPGCCLCWQMWCAAGPRPCWLRIV